MSSRLHRIARAVVAAELPIIVLISPALLFPTPRRLLVLLAVPVIWLCARVATGRAIPPTPLNVTLWLMLVMVGVSLYATFDVTYSLGKVAGVLLGVLLVWAVVRRVRTRADLEWATWGFVACGAGLAGIGLLGTNWFEKFPWLGTVVNHLPRLIRGVPGAVDGFHPNAVAGCLVLFIPVQLAVLATTARSAHAPGAGEDRTHRRRLIAAQALLLVLTMGVLFLTQSRGAWTGVMVSGFAFLCWRGRFTRALAAAVAGVAIVVAATVGPQQLINLAVSRSGPGMAGNVEGRMEVWSRAIYGIQDFPVTGMGMNTFRKLMPVLYPTFLTSPDFDVAHAHNHILQAALDVGIPGLVAYSALWLLLGVMLVRVYRSATVPGMRAIAGGLGAGLIAHFMFSMTDAIPLGAKVGVLFWLTVGMVTALRKVSLTVGQDHVVDSNSHEFPRR